MKQVQEVRAVNGDLETRVSQLTTSNEKLMDSEGRWYSLARELENQMDVIKKVKMQRGRVVFVCFRDNVLLVNSSSSATMSRTCIRLVSSRRLTPVAVMAHL